MSVPCKTGFIAEIISGVAVPGARHALELKVRLVAGKPAHGAARLIEPSGGVSAITILGITQLDHVRPAAVEPSVIYLGVTGVTLDDVHAGQRIIQPEGHVG